MAVAYQSFTEAKAPTNVTELTINKPAGVVEGDLMVAVVIASYGGDSSSSGWTVIQGYISSIACVTFYKIAGADEPDDYTFTWASSYQAYGFIMRITGHDTSTPINVSGLATGTSANPTCPSVTTTKDDCLILRIFGADDDDIAEMCRRCNELRFRMPPGPTTAVNRRTVTGTWYW